MNSSTCPTTSSPRRLRPLVLAGALVAVLAAPLALAQQTGERIEQQMTHEQFMAAGLDQLSAEQLQNLNAWLNRTLVVETTRAATEATRQVRQEVEQKLEQKQRGFLDFGSDEPVTGQLQGGFHGFARGRQYQLDNGQVWRQIDTSSLAGVNLDSPKVTIKPSMIGNAWYLRIEGYNTAAKVERVK